MPLQPLLQGFQKQEDAAEHIAAAVLHITNASGSSHSQASGSMEGSTRAPRCRSRLGTIRAVMLQVASMAALHQHALRHVYAKGPTSSSDRGCQAHLVMMQCVCAVSAASRLQARLAAELPEPSNSQLSDLRLAVLQLAVQGPHLFPIAEDARPVHHVVPKHDRPKLHPAQPCLALLVAFLASQGGVVWSSYNPVGGSRCKKA